MAKKTITVTINRQNIARSSRRIIYAVIIKLQKNYKFKSANTNLAYAKTKDINPPGIVRLIGYPYCLLSESRVIYIWSDILS
jgi:hypothetical protein